ncbi:MAG: DUF2169 domain-containing protein [Acetobacteraceae bacterium]
MRIISKSPFVFAPLPSRVRPPQRSITLILKGTFDIVENAACTPAKDQRPLSGDEVYLDEIGRSLAWASDLAPFKPHTDFFVLGSFHQPGGVAAPTGWASFTLGPLHKKLAIFGPRLARQLGDKSVSVSAPKPIASVPLRWEFSFGGLADRRNPMGMGIDAVQDPDSGTVIPLPLIEDPAHPIRTMKDRPQPANFAPVPSAFEARRRKLGTRDKRWSVFRAPLPPKDYDPSYHNAAPNDQQAGNYPHGDETLVLHNLHPTIPMLTTRLPGLLARAGVIRTSGSGVAAEEVPMHLDTIVALPDEGQLVLTWRGVTRMHGQIMQDDILVMQSEVEALDSPPSGPSLPDRMLQEYQAGVDAAKSAAQADTSFALGEILKLLSKANLPPELMKAIEAETNPQVVYELLDGHLTTIFDGLRARLPPG